MISENLHPYFLIFSGLFFAFSSYGQPQTIQPYQVVFSEIMADPDPPKQLPLCEYIEIYNRGLSGVQLNGCRLKSGSHSTLIPSFVLPSHEYAVLCDPEYADSFSIANVVPLSLPPVSNEGQTLVLLSPQGKIIHSVSYNEKWYKIPVQGGVSLEMIDTENPCGENGNWGASVNENGGTPGFRNSISGNNTDDKPPRLLRATLPDETSILVYFNESLNAENKLQTSYFTTDLGYFHPDSVQLIEPENKQVLLKYKTAFEKNQVYTLSVLNTVEDCVGNILSGNTSVQFALPEPPETFGLVFNEILFHASDNCSEFIEIYNRSDKTFDFSDFALCMADIHNLQIIKTLSFVKFPYLIMPGKYAVITKNAEKLPHNLLNTNPELIIENKNLFAFPDEEGLFVLKDTADNIIDEIQYKSSYHAAILSDDRDISLEKTDPGMPSQNPSGWCSASSLSGYSTPGFCNSQYASSSGSCKVDLSSDIITPDGDGIDDVVEIKITTGEPGWIGTLSIFDLEGRLVNTLFTNSLLGTEELLTWNAKDACDHDTSIGPYIIYLEMITPAGKIQKIKKVISVIRRIN